MGKTKIEILKQLGILGDVRQRLGAEDENDSSCDDRIAALENTQIVAKWAGWHLGDEDWWYIMKNYFDKLNKMDRG